MNPDPQHLTLLQSVLLGLLQGLTEFLPVSSTAHMEIVPQLFGMRDPGAAFSAIVQLGPMVAIIAYFWSDISRYIQGILRTGSPTSPKLKEDLDARLGWYTLLGSLPIMVFGFLLEKKVDTVFRDMRITALSLIALGLILFVAERIGKRNHSLQRMSLNESQVIGWAQVLALIPGTSRSGVTITAGLFQGLDRESAARFSFLLSIPAITAAGLYKTFKVLKHGGLHGDLGVYLVGALVAGVFAYIVVRWFLGYMKEHNTLGFVAYRVLLGLALLALIYTGHVQLKAPVDADDTPAATAPAAANSAVPADTTAAP